KPACGGRRRGFIEIAEVDRAACHIQSLRESLKEITLYIATRRRCFRGALSRIGLSENRFALFGPMLFVFRIGLSENRSHFSVRCSSLRGRP
ncbi:MAG: hypothetical protein AB7F76_13870, partial [Parvibaculaceae bacterium]